MCRALIHNLGTQTEELKFDGKKKLAYDSLGDVSTRQSIGSQKKKIK